MTTKQKDNENKKPESTGDSNVVKTNNIMKSQQQIQAEEKAKNEKKYYEDYPRIIGGICEFCGISYKKCFHYKNHFVKHGEFNCLCGRSKEVAVKTNNKQGVSLLYVPHRGKFVCDAKGCEDQYYKLYSGFEPKVSYNFFVREVPFYGTTLPEPEEITELKK